ncbi:MAG: DUF2628 domain-containing protein [Beijerinckiaceae bacterium]
MAIYTVHIPPDAITPDEVAEKAVFVKEGFAFSGFVFSGFWLLFKQLWLLAIGYGLLFGLVVVAFRSFSLPLAAYGPVTMLMAALVGLEGHEWLRRNYARKGWSHAGTISGPSLAECERRFFKNWLAARDQASSAVPALASRPLSPLAKPQVLGIFPPARGQI